MWKWKLEDRDKPVVGAVLLLALALVALPFLPLPQGETNDSAKKESKGSPLLEAIEAFGTLAIAVYAVRQYREGKKSGERQLRAYIFVEKASCGLVDNKLGARVRFKNFWGFPSF